MVEDDQIKLDIKISGKSVYNAVKTYFETKGNEALEKAVTNAIILIAKEKILHLLTDDLLQESVNRAKGTLAWDHNIMRLKDYHKEQVNEILKDNLEKCKEQITKKVMKLSSKDFQTEVKGWFDVWIKEKFK